MRASYAVAALAVLLSYGGLRATYLSSKPAVAAAAAANVAPADANPADTFTGTIALLNGSLYVLREDGSNTLYHLDDQHMPAKFLGKRVAVTGRLNAAADMISVWDIEPANG